MIYTLPFIVASIPLFFSHIFSSFGIFFIHGSSYERVKVYLFCILICIAVVETCIKKWKMIIQISRAHALLFLSVLVFPLFVHLLSGGHLDLRFLW